MRELPPRRPAPVYKSTLYTPSGNTSQLTVTGGYTVGYIWVFVNGIKVIEGAERDFTATDGSVINFAGTLTTTDIIEIIELWDTDQAIDYRPEMNR